MTTHSALAAKIVCRQCQRNYANDAATKLCKSCNADLLAIVELLKQNGSPFDVWEANGVGYLYVDRASKPTTTAPTTTGADLLGNIASQAAERWGLRLESEYRFAPPRQFRADFALFREGQEKPVLMLEYDGGTWMKTSGGRSAGHAHPKRYASDCEKLNMAAAMGIAVFRYTPDMVRTAAANIHDFLAKGSDQ